MIFSLSSLLWRPAQLYLRVEGWEGGVEPKKEALSLQSAIHIQIQKPAAIWSVANKLRRLALCAFIFMILIWSTETMQKTLKIQVFN